VELGEWIGWKGRWVLSSPRSNDRWWKQRRTPGRFVHWLHIVLPVGSL